MDRTDPGISLFQGKGPKLDLTADRLAEEEELADHKRREDELNHKLQDAFNDLGDDLMNSIDSTATNSILRTNDISNFTEQIVHLKQMVESKTHELIKLNDLLEASEKRSDQLQKHLTICDAERQRALMDAQQCHELLVESKGKISNLEDNICQLQAKIQTSEDENNTLVAELEHTKTMLSDAQHKFRMVEKNAGISAEHRSNDAVQQLKERHNAQVTLMQEQLDSLREKLKEKEHECRNLDTQYKTSVRSREQMLVEKSETINQLSRSLQDAQRQFKNSIPAPDLIQENIKLNRLADGLSQQTETMEKQIKTLTLQLETTHNEMALMNSVLQADGMSSTKRSLPGTPENRMANLKADLYNSKELRIKRLLDDIKAKDEIIKNLKADENDALIKMNTHREEADRWRNKFHIVEADLERTRRDRRHNSVGSEKSAKDEYLQEIQKLEEKNKQLELEIEKSNKNYNQAKRELQDLQDRLSQLNSELENSRQSLNKSVELDKVKLELEKRQFLHKDAQEEVDRVKNLYIKLSSERDNLARELTDLKSSDTHKQLYIEKEKVATLERAHQLSEIKCSELDKILSKTKTEHDQLVQEMRRNCEQNHRNAATALDSCSKCIQQSADVAKLEIQNVQLQTEAATNLREINDLRRRLHSMEVLNQELQSRIQLKDEHDKMLTELKLKAQQFEEFVRSQNESRDASTSPQKVASSDKSVATSPDLDPSHSARLESRLRNEMAKAFAVQLKQVEAEFQTEAQRYDTNANVLKKMIEDARQEIATRSREVDVLKHAILAERNEANSAINGMDEKLKKLWTQKEDAERRCKTQEDVLNQCQSHLQESQSRIEYLSRELQERSDQWSAERVSLQALRRQWEDEKATLIGKEADLRVRIQQLEQQRISTVDQLNAKYQSAKKTAANYKRYAEDKEKHMLQEYDRIKLGYENNLQKIESRMEEYKKTLEEKQRSKIEALKKEYETRSRPTCDIIET